MVEVNVRAPVGQGPIEAPKKPMHQPRVQMPLISEEVEEQKQEELVQTETVKAEAVWPMRIKLGNPILLKDAKTQQVIQQIDVIELREPTAADIIACGVPVIILDYEQFTTTFDGPKMSAMIARLSKIAPPYITNMSPIDWINVATMLQRNFLPDWARML